MIRMLSGPFHKDMARALLWETAAAFRALPNPALGIVSLALVVCLGSVPVLVYRISEKQQKNKKYNKVNGHQMRLRF